jgi:hypothetical protein
MRHELKTWPGGFDAISRQLKSHEIRPADRDFRVGDELLLREWVPAHLFGCEWTREGTCDLCGREIGKPAIGRYTGRELSVIVTYITPEGKFGCPAGFVVMSVSLIRRVQDAEVQGKARSY